MKLLAVLDWIRILIVSFAFYFGYSIGFAGEIYNPEAQLHFMIPVIIFAVAGLSGLEGLFFGDETAKIKGYETGSNYQKQSDIALLSYAVVAILVFFFEWGIKAELTILFTFLFFFFFSGLNHAFDAIKRKNYKWQNINRPFIMLLLIAGLIYPVLEALKRL
ncbi:MAG: hypothetical protein IAE91_15415 [Ignavibacteriaceae bacterium]|nr:hypothetical protein [Ignavibacteriaceae bacterium]